ncbi:OB-fold nucleic acid binding domain-containing protein [Methanotorris formicicus]|uniref:Nucleic acid binding OB-fold tRNA/helicase-type n=1 Tax=Methanotorris formicicus Mc-S-70 TaxID=647171 RepID=H1KZN6_9EURY|nr:OB-fold nucleic acid binding domain-containing protein [Methanotorris formicicus]EHP85777.1 hypothetical protein MetfoDRAFT_1259 [Methanotorris formicicus Mc-S-70]
MPTVKRFNTNKILKHTKASPSATISIIFWITIVVLATTFSKNIWIFILSIPFIVGLIVIPLKISKMNNEISEQLIPLYEKNAKSYKIKDITKETLNQWVKVSGIVEKVIYGLSPKPTIKIKDETGEIFANLIVAPNDNIKKGDKVEIYGVVTKHYKFFGFMGIPKLWKPKIYGIGVKKLS